MVIGLDGYLSWAAAGSEALVATAKVIAAIIANLVIFPSQARSSPRRFSISLAAKAAVANAGGRQTKRKKGGPKTALETSCAEPELRPPRLPP
jgi:hypothetical protein